MSKRNLFDELTEGFDALKAEREGKKTLRTRTIEVTETPVLSASELRDIRKRFHMSQAVFANSLHTKVRTYQNWEQGKSAPDSGTTTLIRLVEKHPETLEKIAAL